MPCTRAITGFGSATMLSISCAHWREHRLISWRPGLARSSLQIVAGAEGRAGAGDHHHPRMRGRRRPRSSAPRSAVISATESALRAAGPVEGEGDHTAVVPPQHEEFGAVHSAFLSARISFLWASRFNRKLSPGAELALW